MRDDGIAYAEALNKAGLSARLQVFLGVPHEFTTIDGLQSREKWCIRLVESVRSLLSPEDFAMRPH